MSCIVLDGFAGPGGWSVAMQRLGLLEVGIELDEAACATRAAAGHLTIRADVSRFPVGQLAGRVTGSAWSPPCIFFSAAGTRAGSAVIDILAEAVRDQFAGRKTLALRRRQMAAVLRKAGWPDPKAPRSASYARMPRAGKRKGKRQVIQSPGRGNAIWKAVRSAALVVEPARFIAATLPEWITLEQVPDVLPLWQVYAEELRKLGYSVWCGKLNAADYGVPQTRERAILIASRVRRVSRPSPTHYDARKGLQMFGSPWVSMAEALGMGATARPAPTVTAGGTRTGGAEPFGHRDRDALEAERDAGRWVLAGPYRSSPGDRTRPRGMDEPATTVAFGHSSMVLRRNHAGVAEGDAADNWALRMDTQAKATHPRPVGEPAPTIQFAHRANLAAWVRERPGHKDRSAGSESQFAEESVRVTVEEAAALQSFPADYPWQGSKTKQYEQCGNAWCPLAAIAVLGEAAGIDWQPVAEKYAAETRLIVAGAA